MFPITVLYVLYDRNWCAVCAVFPIAVCVFSSITSHNSSERSWMPAIARPHAQNPCRRSDLPSPSHKWIWMLSSLQRKACFCRGYWPLAIAMLVSGVYPHHSIDPFAPLSSFARTLDLAKDPVAWITEQFSYRHARIEVLLPPGSLACLAHFGSCTMIKSTIFRPSKQHGMYCTYIICVCIKLICTFVLGILGGGGNTIIG